MTFEELVGKVIEKLKTEKLISDDVITAVKTDESKGTIDLAELSKTVSAEVWEKFKTELDALKVEEAAKEARAKEAAGLVPKKKADPENKGAPAIVHGVNDTKGMSEENGQLYEALKSKNSPDVSIEMEIKQEEIESVNRAKADATALDSGTGRGAEWLRIGFMSGVYSQLSETGVGELLGKFKRVFTNLTNPLYAQLVPPTSGEIIRGLPDQSTAVKDISPIKITTANKTFDIVKVVSKSIIYQDTIDDTGQNIIKITRDSLADQSAIDQVKGVVNGDDSGTHMDTDTELLGQTVPERGYKGLRKLAIAGGLTVDMNASAGVTLAAMDLLPVNMGKYSTQQAAGTFWLCSDKIWHNLRALADFKTAEKAGKYLNLVNGVLVGYMGYPIVPCSLVRDDIDVTGVNGAANNTFTSMLLVNPQHFLIVVKKKLNVRVINDPLNDCKVIVADTRMTFGPKKAPSATIKSLTLGIDLV